MQSPARSLSMLTRAGLDAADDDAVADPPLEDSALDDDPAPPVAELAGGGTCCPAPVTVLVQPASSAPPTSVTSNLRIRVPPNRITNLCTPQTTRSPMAHAWTHPQDPRRVGGADALNSARPRATRGNCGRSADQARLLCRLFELAQSAASGRGAKPVISDAARRRARRRLRRDSDEALHGCAVGGGSCRDSHLRSCAALRPHMSDAMSWDLPLLTVLR